MSTRTYAWGRLFALLICISVGHGSQATSLDQKIPAALAASLRTVGYEITERPRGSDSQVMSLEHRDSNAYNPSSQTFFRLRSLRPWRRSSSTYFRYWLIRETYDSEERAETRIKEYLTNYTERLATPTMSSHMISKTILRVGAKRRGTTVFLLVTDAAYTLFDDKKKDEILNRLVEATGT